jgi:hypothetical protein
MAEESGNNIKKVKSPGFIKELLSGSMISEKLILKNLGYVSLITLLPYTLETDSMRKK